MDWTRRNRKNIVAIALILAMLFAVFYFVPGTARFFKSVLNLAGSFAMVILGIVCVVFPLFLGILAPGVVTTLDRTMGPSNEIDQTLRVMLILVMGVVLTVLYVIGLAALTNIATYGATYQAMIGNVAAFQEAPLSAWMWFVLGYIFYVVGWAMKNGI